MVSFRSSVGKNVIVQASASGYAGVLEKCGGGWLVLSSVKVLDNAARSPEWVPADGFVHIPISQVQHVQAVG